MRITADTNILVRAMTDDDARQGRIARDALARAEMVALTSPTLCELAWVLSRGYKIPAGEIAAGFRRLLDAANVVVNRPAAEAGLAHLEAGGDFADGVIAFEGADLGADTFVSFDKSAVKLTLAHGMAARLLA
ncbi:MAG: type II toxin-antitoxin system VapC family toxin [Roseiarcus sp.]